MLKELVEDCNGALIISSCKTSSVENFGVFSDSPDWRVLVGFSLNSMYSMLFSSKQKRSC